MRYFSKEVPKTPIWLPDGTALKFETLDGRTGFHATDNPQQIEWLVKLQQERRGGVHEITAQEFDAQFVKKKPQSQPYNFNSLQREEISPGVAPDTVGIRPPQPAPVAAPAVTNPVNPVAAPAPEPASKPARKVGKRSSRD